MTASVIIGLAAAAAAATGFGFNLVSAPLLTLFYPAPRVVAVTLLLGVCTSGLLLLRRDVRRAVEWDVVRPLFLASLVGMPAGLALLLWGRPQLLKAGIAALTAVFAVAMLARVRPRLHGNLINALGVGVVSGVLSTSTSLNGPPIALYLVARGLTKGGFRSNMVAYVLLTSATSALVLLLGGAIGAATARMAAELLPALGIGFAVGIAGADRLSDRQFEVFVLCFLAAVGVLGVGAAMR